jgi:hypothetical protein
MGDRRGQYPAELRRRAVRLVAESKGEYESEWAAITSITPHQPNKALLADRPWTRPNPLASQAA